MQNIELSARAFNRSDSENCNISIWLLSNGFVFCIYSLERNCVVHLSDLQPLASDAAENLKAMFEQNPLMKLRYRKVRIVCEARNYTLVPAVIFDKQDVNRYWTLNFGKEPEAESRLLSDYISMNESVLLYSVPGKVVDAASSVFADAEICCQQAPVIADALFKSKSENGEVLSVCVNDGFFDVALADRGNLLLANSFDCRTADEFLYFTLNIFEQFRLNQQTSGVVLSGQVGERDIRMAELKKYVKRVSLATVPNGIDVAKEILNKADAHRYAPIFSSFNL